MSAVTTTVDSKIQSENVEEYEHLSLDTIPVELFLRICSFLRSRFVIEILSKVCQKFDDIVSDSFTWKIRIRDRWPQIYPPLPIGNMEFNWQLACADREDQHELWSDPQENFYSFKFSDQHLGSVNVIHFLMNGKLCASGSRDKSIGIWGVDKMCSNVDVAASEVCKIVISDAHKGWVWSLASHDHHLYSCGFDNFVKGWDINATQVNTALFAIRYNSAVLSIANCGNLLACGTWNKRVHMIDIRTNKKVVNLNYHSGSVLCLAIDEKYMMSCSDDKTVVIRDLAAGKNLSTITFDFIPLCMSLAYGQLWVGDSKGGMHLINPSSGKDEPVATYDSGHLTKVNGVNYSLGCILTCSSDRSLRIHEPSLNPGLINSVQLDSLGEIACVDSTDEHVVAACAEHEVFFWVPKKNQDL